MTKTIGFFSIFCISAGAMISSGLFVLPGLAFAEAGPIVFISYFIAGCIALSTVLSLSELITAMPKAGGDYFYVSRSFGLLFGTVSGFLSWLALSLKSAFAIVGIAELIYITFNINLTISSIILALIFTGLNLLGVKEAVRFQVIMVIMLIGILIVFFFNGVQEISLQRFEPFVPNGIDSVFFTAGFVFVSFGGVLTTASIAGEIRNPTKNIPAGFIWSTIIVTILYAFVIFVLVGILPPEQLRKSLAPVALAARVSGGTPFYVAIIIASLLAFVTTANGGILTASRYPLALSQDRMLPEIFGKTIGSKETPYISIITTGLLIALSLLMNLDLLVKAASTVILLTNIFAHLSVVVMRESLVANYLPTFRAPLYPWLQISGIIVFSLLIINMGIQPVLLSLLFISAGVILFFIRKDKSDKISPALIHLIQRITNRELVTDGLTSELRTIVEDRDEIIRDEFDSAVEESCFLEVSGRIDVEQLWDLVSHEPSNCIPPHLPPQKLLEFLKKRENESSTAISHFVAIPHIIVEGNQIFRVIFIRAKQGVSFSSEFKAIHAVFILIGSRDMRNLHLRALAAIAQVVHHHHFEKEWIKARNQRELKDLFLLSKRNRKM